MVVLDIAKARTGMADLRDLTDDELTRELLRLILAACDVELEIQNRKRRQAGEAEISVFPAIDRAPTGATTEELSGFGRDIEPIRVAITTAVEPPSGADE